jgi:hypothetical protein
MRPFGAACVSIVPARGADQRILFTWPTGLWVGYHSRVRVIFILPGLLRPTPEAQGRDLHCLEYLLARSRVESSWEADGRLLLLASLIPDHDAITESEAAYWSDFHRHPAGYCYYCEPVHLRADLSDAIVFDRSQFTLTMAEARSLVEAMNRYLSEDGCEVELAGPDRWYLLSGNEIGREIPTLREMRGRPAGPVLTDSRVTGRWRRLMSELQIVLYQQPINAQRERRGELPVNGVWIHQGRPVAALGYAVARVVSGSSTAQAVCRELALDCVGELGEPALPVTGGDLLIFDESLESATENPGLRLQWMEKNWFRTVYSWLRLGRISEIVIDPADGRRFVIRRNFLNRFWKRRKPLDSYARQNT